jgi:hypothetical protein
MDIDYGCKMNWRSQFLDCIIFLSIFNFVYKFIIINLE